MRTTITCTSCPSNLYRTDTGYTIELPESTYNTSCMHIAALSENILKYRFDYPEIDQGYNLNITSDGVVYLYKADSDLVIYDILQPEESTTNFDDIIASTYSGLVTDVTKIPLDYTEILCTIDDDKNLIVPYNELYTTDGYIHFDSPCEYDTTDEYGHYIATSIIDTNFTFYKAQEFRFNCDIELDVTNSEYTLIEAGNTITATLIYSEDTQFSDITTFNISVNDSVTVVPTKTLLKIERG